MSMAFAGLRWQWIVPRDASLKREVETIQSILHDTRLHAAMKRTSARMLIHADPERDEDKAFRELVIQILEEDVSDTWRTVGSVHTLAISHQIVPLRGEADSLVPDASQGLQKVDAEAASDLWGEWVRCYSLEFKPTGRISSTSYVLVIEQLAATNEKPLYRALRVNSYGQLTQLVSPQDHEKTR